MHHEPPDEVCGVLELDVGFDLGDFRPVDFLAVPVEVEPLGLVSLPWLIEVLVWLVGLLDALAVDDAMPGNA
jgi:hypothetical protein